MGQRTRYYILLRISTTSFSQILFLHFASFCVDPGLAVSVVFSPVIVPVSFTTDFVILIPSSVPCVNVVVFGDVYGAVVDGGGHVNIPTFLELQIRSVQKFTTEKSCSLQSVT